MADLVKRPRPFSLAIGVFFVIIGLAAVVAGTTADVDAGAVAALGLLFSGAAALFALATRRAPTPEVEQD